MFELSAQAKEKYEIKMYGTISEWEKVNASDFSVAMANALAKGAKEITLPTHSGGGSIYEGVAIGNDILRARAKGVKVICRIDGLCASMMTVVAIDCDEVHAASNIRMMVHEGSVSLMRGNVKTLRESADQLESLNTDIAEKIAKKTGKTKEWILSNWMVPGVDKWFKASEARDAKLVDVVLPPYDKQLPAPNANMNWGEMAASLDEFFKPDNKMKEKLIAILGLDANATDEQIDAAIAAKKATDAKAKEDAKANADAGSKNEDKAVALVMKIAAERGVTDAKKLENIKAVAVINIDAAMDMLPGEKREEEQLRLSDVIAQLKGEKNGDLGNRREWSFDDWQTKDPKGLQGLLEKEPKKFKAIFKAQFGIEPSDEELQLVMS